jgi:uncharacterized protein YgbK (DUF1537 family)
MLLGVIADDFTGASDIADTIAGGLPGHGGLKTAQFLGVPRQPAPEGIEAGVVALKSRSIPAAEAIAQALTALDWLRAQGCRQIVFKYCSTFDSTPAGNIGPVAEALAVSLGVAGVVVCPAFPPLGRTVYQGHLFVRDRLLSESGLEHHPINPMTDPDIRRWLTRQARGAVGLVAWQTLDTGPRALRAALDAAAARGERLVVVDAIADADLLAIAEACHDDPLITGGSGVALGLAENFIRRGLASGGERDAPSVEGPAAVLAGSCSGTTRGQIELFTATHPALAIDVDAVMAGRITAAEVAAFLLSGGEAVPIAYSSASPEEVRALQDRHGREKVSAALDTLFADTARRLVAGGIRRLVVAGGETSGAVVSALDLGALTIGGEIDPGVPTLVSTGERPIALALKSGNFGAPDFFDKALGRLEGRR